MKHIKVILISLMFCLVLVGCSSNVKTPYTVAIGNKAISYYDDKSSLNDKYGNVLISFKEWNIEEMFNEINEDFIIFYNNNDKIRALVITSEKVITMHGIHVGDDISKVEDKFEYEKVMGNSLCDVLFDGLTEANDFENPQDDWIRISYRINEEKITAIIISDNKFACYLQ